MKDDDDNGLFESVGKAADKIGETSIGKRIGAVITVILLALLSGGANMTVLHDYFNGDDGPIGGCMQSDATNYNSKATFDDGSCNFLVIVYGCTNAEAENYNANATHDNGRCIVDVGPPVNETVYGCMDAEANNYNDKATDDDGSCDYEDEYEEPECNLTEVFFWKGWEDQDGNATGYMLVDSGTATNDGIYVYTDIDSDCGEVDVTVYLDVWSFNDVDGDGVYEEEEGDEYYYFTKEFNFTVADAVWDDHWLNMTYEELNETNGDYEAYVYLGADIDGDGELEFYEYMYIPEIRVEA